LAEDDALQALFDRFLLRCRVNNLPRESMPALLSAGWALESGEAFHSSVTADDLRGLVRRVYAVDLSAVSAQYAEAVFKIRDLGIAMSDRRAVKVMKLLAASAVLCGRAAAAPSDLWVLAVCLGPRGADRPAVASHQRHSGSNGPARRRGPSARGHAAGWMPRRSPNSSGDRGRVGRGGLSLAAVARIRDTSRGWPIRRVGRRRGRPTTPFGPGGKDPQTVG